MGGIGSRRSNRHPPRRCTRDNHIGPASRPMCIFRPFSRRSDWLASCLGPATSPARDEEEEMSNQSEKSEGTAQRLGGKLKKGIGRVLGNRRLEAKGRAN